jgi:hypothetical protein
MPRLGDRFLTFEPAIRALANQHAIEVADVRTPAFELERDRRVVIYYAPVDWLFPTAACSLGRAELVAA